MIFNIVRDIFQCTDDGVNPVRGWQVAYLNDKYVGENDQTVLQVYQSHLEEKKERLELAIKNANKTKSTTKSRYASEKSKYLSTHLGIQNPRPITKTRQAPSSSGATLYQQKLVETKQEILRLGGVVDASGAVDWASSQPVTYWPDAQRNLLKCWIAGGVLVNNSGPVNTAGQRAFVAQRDYGIYTLVPEGGVKGGKLSLYIDCAAGPRGARVHHSSAPQGKPVSCAGEIKVVSGRIERINNQSGHYAPTTSMLALMLDFLGVMRTNTGAREKINARSFSIEDKRTGITHPNVDAFIRQYQEVDIDQSTPFSAFDVEKSAQQVADHIMNYVKSIDKNLLTKESMVLNVMIQGKMSQRNPRGVPATIKINGRMENVYIWPEPKQGYLLVRYKSQDEFGPGKTPDMDDYDLVTPRDLRRWAKNVDQT